MRAIWRTWTAIATAIAALVGCEETGYGGVCLSDGICSDIWSEDECATSSSYAQWHAGDRCSDFDYTVSCNDGTDFRCRPSDWTPPHDPEASGGCTDTCDDAHDGYCDDGGPGSDYSGCSLGTDCDDCGSRDASSNGVPSEGPSTQPSDTGPSLYSTLCYALTTTSAAENLEINCTSNAATGCDVFGMQTSEYVYSSRSVCLADALNVLDHWQSTGVVGGATPDVDTSTSGSAPSGGAGGSGSHDCPEDHPYSSADTVPRGNVNLVILGCYVGNHCPGYMTSTWSSYCLGAAGTCMLTVVQERCGETINLSGLTSFGYHYGNADSRANYNGQWKPAYDGDTLNLTLP